MVGRRVARKRVRLAGRVWNDVAQELQEALDQLFDSNDNGIPPGFYDTTPTEVTADSPGDPGLETAGWAAADHDHPVNTAAPTNPTGAAASEGSGSALMRADATVKQGIVTTLGDLLGFSTVPARIAVGTDGQVLTADSGDPLGVAWADATGGSGGGAAAILDLVESHDFAAPATSFTFSGLDGDTHELYFLVFRFIKGVAAATNIDLRPNGVITNQEMRAAYYGTAGAGTLTATAFRLSANGSAVIGWADVGHAWIDAKTGTNRTGRVNYAQAGPTTDIYELDAALVWDEKVTNITSFDVVCDQANGIGAGSYVRLYKLNKVAAGGGSSSISRLFMLMGA